MSTDQTEPDRVVSAQDTGRKRLIPTAPPKPADFDGSTTANRDSIEAAPTIDETNNRQFTRQRHLGAGGPTTVADATAFEPSVAAEATTLVPAPPPPRPAGHSDKIEEGEDAENTNSESAANILFNDPLSFLAKHQEAAYRVLVAKEEDMTFEVLASQGWFEGGVLGLVEHETETRFGLVEADEALRRSDLSESEAHWAWKTSLLTNRKAVLSEETRSRAKMLEAETEGWHSITAAVVGRHYYWIFGREARARIRLTVEYFTMLMEFCEALEILHRRDLIHKIVPLAHVAMASTERRGWLSARRNEMARRDYEYQKGEEADMKRRQKYFEWSFSLLQSRTNIEKAEAASRVVNMYSKERKAYQTIIDLANIEYPILLRKHLKEKALFARLNTTVEWTPETYERVGLGEASGRNEVAAAQKEVWHRLVADEAREYLTVRREELVNAEMHKIMAAYDARAAANAATASGSASNY
eukprot:GILI01028200.1.p1 GENE.GILI01028200.1~~GILI01028200.1.p1  ORF type:complete len:472 (+),score=83.51 GILI01028200.1:47-1462(+)